MRPKQDLKPDSQLETANVRRYTPLVIVQEHEFQNLISFNTKINQGLTSWDDGIVILDQHQVVCTIKLWYQKIFMDNFKEGGCIDGITPKIGICLHNCQNLCQYWINFKDFNIKM